MAGTVGRITRVEKAGRAPVVEVDGRSVEVDRRYADLLDQLVEHGRLVHVEVDGPDAGALRLPAVGAVAELVERDGQLLVTVGRSHALHALRPGTEGFDEMAAALRRAREDGTSLAVTIDDLRGVIDVRPDPGGPSRPSPEPPPFPEKPKPYELSYLLWPFRAAFAWLTAVSPSKAQSVFDGLKGKVCTPPVTSPSPCIPFNYPDDGCWIRAEMMVRLMKAQGISSRKVWSSGSLKADTVNHPQCYVTWGWHVAPTIWVRAGWIWVVRKVMDPALFDGPVTSQEWATRQQAAALEHTGAQKYAPWDPGPVTDAEVESDMEHYRIDLRYRSAGASGPPPYANC